MPRHLARQDTTTIVVTPTVDGSIITSGTTVINVNPTGSNFDLNTSATGSLSFSQVSILYSCATSGKLTPEPTPRKVYSTSLEHEPFSSRCLDLCCCHCQATNSSQDSGRHLCRRFRARRRPRPLRPLVRLSIEEEQECSSRRRRSQHFEEYLGRRCRYQSNPTCKPRNDQGRICQ